MYVARHNITVPCVRFVQRHVGMMLRVHACVRVSSLGLGGVLLLLQPSGWVQRPVCECATRKMNLTLCTHAHNYITMM